jgi:CelD/BcsL family acetyltransferase involved in cellulose biosynthesis
VWRVVQMLETNPLLAALDEAFRAAGATVVRRSEPPSFFLPLPPSYDEYLAARSSKFRNYLRRSEKKLVASGELTVVTSGVEIGFDAAFDALLAIEAASWKHGHGTAISAIPHQAAFYRAMSREMAGDGRLHLTLLRRDGEPIAYNLGLVWQRQYAYLKTSYVESLKALGPSTVLRARLVARLIEEGLEALDFPAEPYEWEAQWTTAHRPHQSLVVYNRTLRARAYAWAKRLKDARRPIAAEGIAYANARDLRAPTDGE